MITLSGDVELNPGPKCKAAQTFSVCHCNLKSIWAHNLAKLSLLRGYVSVHKFDIICLSEIYLDSSIDDESLEISGHYLICSDVPSNKKHGGICIYYKNFLPLKLTGARLLDESSGMKVSGMKKIAALLKEFQLKISRRSLDYIK